MANTLLERLRSDDKKGLFEQSQTSINYPTGFMPFDYRNGYRVEVRNDNEELIDNYAAIGIQGGTFVTVIGKSGTAKTTFIAQAAYNIVRPFEDNAFVIHYDLEQVLTYTRIKNITGASQIALKDKYIIRQEKNYIEDIFDSIVKICNVKDANKKEFMYDTGLLDEFGEKIKAFVPTVIIIDSIPTLTSKDSDDEMKGSTEQMRKAKELKQFYSKLMPLIKTYNITVFAVNHINVKMEMNAFTKTQPQVMYMKVDEAVPGGNAPIYYANNLLKFVSSTKFNEEDNGFDGFLIRAEFLKSRSNKAGKSINMVYNQLTGFDPILTLYQFAEDNDLVDGRNPYRYFKHNKDVKFDSRKFRKAFLENDAVRIAITEATKPILEDMLSFVKEDDKKADNYSETLFNLFNSYENDNTL